MTNISAEQRASDMAKAEAQAMKASLSEFAATQKAEAEARATAQRNAPPSAFSSRYVTGGGMARFSSPAHGEIPDYVLKAEPTIAKLHKAWEDTNAAATALRAEWKAKAEAHGDLGVWRNGVFTPRDGVTHAQLDEAAAVRDATDRAIKANERLALKAIKALDDALNSREAIAARSGRAALAALEAHAEVVSAFETLKRAITQRDSATRASGAQHKPWTERQSLGAVYNRADGGLSDALSILRAAVEGYDVAAIEAVAK